MPGIVLLVLLVTGIGTGYYLTSQYPTEWNYWKNLSGFEKRRAVSLEIKRWWHGIFPPAPQPERYAHVTAETLGTFNTPRLPIGSSLCKSITGGFNTGMIPLVISSARKPTITFCAKQAPSFSLALVYEMTGEPRYLEAARRSVQYLLAFTESLDTDKAYFLFRQKAKLGGISLPMLTMLKNSSAYRKRLNTIRS